MAEVEPLEESEVAYIRAKSEQLLKLIEETMGFRLTYDVQGVEKLSSFIEDLRAKGRPEQFEHIINPCGYFLGEAILASVAGKWVLHEQEPAIQLDVGGIGFPITKVHKHIENGLTDNILGLFRYCVHRANEGKKP